MLLLAKIETFSDISKLLESFCRFLPPESRYFILFANLNIFSYLCIYLEIFLFKFWNFRFFLLPLQSE